MPKKKNVDPDQLIKAVTSGMASTEIMDKFGIKTSAQLKSLYLDALVAIGQATPITTRGGRSSRVAQSSKEITVNKRGSLVITKEMVADMGFAIEDLFTVRKTKSGISLKKS